MAAEGINPFEQWSEVVKLLQEKDPMLHSYLRKSKAYFDGTRVLIDGGKTFRDFIRVTRTASAHQKLIAQVVRRRGADRPLRTPHRRKAHLQRRTVLHALEKLGLRTVRKEALMGLGGQPKGRKR